MLVMIAIFLLVRCARRASTFLLHQQNSKRPPDASRSREMYFTCPSTIHHSSASIALLIGLLIASWPAGSTCPEHCKLSGCSETPRSAFHSTRCQHSTTYQSHSPVLLAKARRAAQIYGLWFWTKTTALQFPIKMRSMKPTK